MYVWQAMKRTGTSPVVEEDCDEVFNAVSGLCADESRVSNVEVLTEHLTSVPLKGLHQSFHVI